ncbi:MAG: hypothetical protein DCE86_15005 [Flavobacteriaceae bacterium]|nr:MAG: hypothetical protein DCE86_15005 [Flavobacteriaceae bacterium]
MTKRHPQLSDAHATLLRYKVSKMYNRGQFDVTNLRRSISKHCKTWLIGNRLGLKIKKSDKGIFCYIGDTIDCVTIIEVHSSVHPTKDFTFNVANNREFMNKLFKHDLL